MEDLEQEAVGGLLAIQVPPPNPGLSRLSNTHYRFCCGLLGCNLTVRNGSNYCCLDHQQLGIDNITKRGAFEYIGGFRDKKDMDRSCYTCLQNRLRGVEVGIPTFTSDVFRRAPWVQVDVFNTGGIGRCHWLFFVQPPISYSSMTDQPKWKVQPKHPLKFGSDLPPREEDWVYRNPFTLKDTETHDFHLEAQRWDLYLFQCRQYHLYVLTRDGIDCGMSEMDIVEVRPIPKKKKKDQDGDTKDGSRRKDPSAGNKRSNDGTVKIAPSMGKGNNSSGIMAGTEGDLSQQLLLESDLSTLGKGKGSLNILNGTEIVGGDFSQQLLLESDLSSLGKGKGGLDILNGTEIIGGDFSQQLLLESDLSTLGKGKGSLDILNGTEMGLGNYSNIGDGEH